MIWNFINIWFEILLIFDYVLISYFIWHFIWYLRFEIWFNIWFDLWFLLQKFFYCCFFIYKTNLTISLVHWFTCFCWFVECDTTLFVGCFSLSACRCRRTSQAIAWRSNHFFGSVVRLFSRNIQQLFRRRRQSICILKQWF